MPAAIEHLVQKFLSQKDFYPALSESERKTWALVIAHKQVDGSPEDPVIFTASQEGGPEFTLVRASDGAASMLMFKNAVLCRPEVNANRDQIDDAGIDALAATIGGWPIDVEHRIAENVGTFLAGRKGTSGEMLTDGVVWADRFPDVAQGIMDGSYGLSIEARAATAQCSVCQEVFVKASEYCDHLNNRRASGAVRILGGLKARGGAVTKRPAGTNTKFDQGEIHIIASHGESNVDQEAANRLLRNKPKEIQVEGASMEEILAKYNEALQTIASLNSQLDAAKKQMADDDEDEEKKANEMKSSLEAANAIIAELRMQVRRTRLGSLVTDDEWTKQKAIYGSMTDEAFDLVASKLTTAPTPPATPPAQIVLESNTDGAGRVSLR